LAVIKSGIQSGTKQDRISLSDFKEIVKSVLKNHEKCDEICDRVGDVIVSKNITTTVEDGEKYADYERIIQLIEFVQYYPIIVKRNKNASPGMDKVMMNRDPVSQSLL